MKRKLFWLDIRVALMTAGMWIVLLHSLNPVTMFLLAFAAYYGIYTLVDKAAMHHFMRNEQQRMRDVVEVVSLEGENAFKEGKTIDDNPYIPNGIKDPIDYELIIKYNAWGFSFEAARISSLTKEQERESASN